MANLKRSLFIGLGGTGAQAILHTKKRFIDAYDEIPPMIGFLSIDTDQDTRNKSLFDNLNNEIKFDGAEFLYTRVQDAQRPYKIKRDSLFKWYPEDNVPMLIKMTNGAGQIRSNGRFSLFFNYSQIYHAISHKLNQILSIDNFENSKFQPNGDDVEINFVFSVGGGTGSGTFIDIAYLVQDAISKFPNAIKTVAFMVLPDVFTAMATGPSMKNVRPNGYGALQDLDYLMHFDYNSSPLNITYDNKSIEIERPPFDVVFTINNKNSSGHTFQNISEISELIGLGMFTGASELCGSAQSSYDNVETVLAAGTLDVEDKRAWACGMGLSELFYDGNKLGNIYARKAIKSIINKLLTADQEVSSLVDAFIDNPEVEIRENNGDENNFLIDSLLPEEPRIPLTYIDDPENPKAEIKGYLSNIEDSAIKDVQANYTKKLNRVQEELNKFLNKNLNRDSGVGNVLEILKLLEKQIHIFKGEMETELEVLREDKISFEHQLEMSTRELIEVATKFSLIGKQKKINEKKEELLGVVSAKASNFHGQLRREWAIKFFTKFTNELNDHKEKVKNLTLKLQLVGDRAISEAASIQNKVNDKSKTFVIELHKRDVNKIRVNEDTVNVSGFIDKLPYEQGLYDLAGIEEDLIYNYLWKHTKKLNETLTYRNKKIDDILNELSAEDLQEALKNLIIKSNPLWSYDFKGHVLNPDIHSSFIIGIPDINNSRLTKSNILAEIMDAEVKYQFTSTNVQDRVVIYRMEAATPIFAINDVSGYYEDYKRSKINHHIDSIWKTRMDREGFKLMPQGDDPKKKYATWVGGFIYGFIKNDNGTYKAYSPDKGDALDDYWIELSPYRDEAFNEFNRYDMIEEMSPLIEERIAKIGIEENEKLISNTKEGTQYRDSISQIEMTTDELKKRENKTILKLFREEIDFVKKELAN